MIKKNKNKTLIIFGIILVTVLSMYIFANHLPAQAATIEIETNNPVLLLEKTSLEPAVAGDEFTLGLSIRNLSNNPGLELNVSFNLKGEQTLAPFTLKPNQITTIDSIGGMETRTMQFTFAVDRDAQNKDYTLNIVLRGKNAQMQESVLAMTSITVPVTYDVTTPVLVVDSASVSPENADIYEGFDVHFKINNLSKTTDAHNIVLLLDGADNFEVLDISNKKNIIKLAKNEDRVVTYRLRAKDTKSDNSVKLEIGFDYRGTSAEKVVETINLPLPREDIGIGATPWVIVNKYTLSAEQVLAGDTVTLRLFMENTNHRPVKNVKISLGVITVEQGSGGTTTGGTVFSPVNSSNSFYLDEIPGKTIIEKEISLYVDPNAAAKTYIVPVTISYEDRKGKTLECEELVNIPVTQECKLNVLSVQVPTEGFVGQPIQVSAEFVNVGKVALGNFMVTLEGDFQKNNGTYYVGTLDIGFNDFFQGAVIPEKEGPLEGMLVFSYIDNNNKDVRVEEPFTIQIQGTPPQPMGPDGEVMGPLEPGMKPGMMPGRPSSQGGFVASVKKHWLNGLLLVVMILEGVYIWRIKRKRNNEEFFNE